MEAAEEASRPLPRQPPRPRSRAEGSEDVDIWEHAKANNFVIVTKDMDFQQRSLLYGHPPKVVRLRVGNCAVQTIEDLLRRYSALIHTFGLDAAKSYLALP